MMISLSIAFRHALLLLASVAWATAASAQDRTDAARAVHGKLVVRADQGSMSNSGAGGPARYRAELATASRVLSVVKRDSAFAHPIGFDMWTWRLAGPNEPPASLVFPGYSGINDVLMYYFYNESTHKLESSTEGLGFKVLVNDPTCMLPKEWISDEHGPIGTAIPRGDDYRGFPTYADGTCIVVTNSTKPFTVPVSRQRWLRAQIRHRRALLDTVRASETRDDPAAFASGPERAYQQWLADRPEREAQRKRMLDVERRMNPAGIPDLQRQWAKADSSYEAGMKDMIAQSKKPDPELEALQRQAAAADTRAEQAIQSLESQLAHMSPADLAAPAYVDIRSTTPTQLVEPTAPGAVALVAPNEGFRDRSLPESAAQVIVVHVDCRKAGDRIVGGACGQDVYQDIGRILDSLDWTALRSLLAKGR